MRESITTGGVPFRKAYIQAVVDRVEVDDHAIRIVGDKATLEQVVAGQASTAAVGRSFVLGGRNLARPKRLELLTPQIRSLVNDVEIIEVRYRKKWIGSSIT
jgi:hypothetical protein